MNYYSYDSKSCKLLSKIQDPKVYQNYVCSEESFDLDFYNVYVGLLSRDKKILKRTIEPKSNLELINQIAILREENETRFSDLEVAIAELYGGGET